MVNGNYILYGDRPSSESEIVDDHVQTRTLEKKKRKTNRNANDLQRSLNLSHLDNETDSIKYEKKIKEPRLLRYVSNTEVEEHVVNEKFETADRYVFKTPNEPPRRYAFTKKPKNPSDGSVHYAYSRSSSSCSSPGGNLPTIVEHTEHYGHEYRARAPSPEYYQPRYDHKLDKYFGKPRDLKKLPKVGYNGSHPDSLYRVQAGSADGKGRLARAARLLRWPAALLTVCVALALFVYFLMPDTLDVESDVLNATYWEANTAGGHLHHVKVPDKTDQTEKATDNDAGQTRSPALGTKTTEIDFYAVSNDDRTVHSIVDVIKETAKKNRNLPVPPVFPSHLAPEVQYGNEKADVDNLRNPKLLQDNYVPDDSTVKPHITHKPEKPLAIYFKDGVVVSSTENIVKAETINDFSGHKDRTPGAKGPEIQRNSYYSNQNKYQNNEYSGGPESGKINFTSGHSMLFGISIEDAEKYKSTTQSTIYNTKVSPTLPVWREGYDTTTKKYPIQSAADGQPQCRSTRLEVCRGVLPYDLAMTTSIFSTGADAETILTQVEYIVSSNCSDRARHFICSLLEPECSPPPNTPRMPCKNLCKAVLDDCEGLIPQELIPMFDCKLYPDSECSSARSPCFAREIACGDGSCIPKEQVCDGSFDCPAGEDESQCAACAKNEYRCRIGGCIQKRWLCDGYADCTDGEDETEATCATAVPQPRVELGEEPSGSAPAPAVRKPNKPHRFEKTYNSHGAVDSDNSKELLMTSDSSNALKRNYTRRPSPSRLTPYTRTSPRPSETKPIGNGDQTITVVYPTEINGNTNTKMVESNTDKDTVIDKGEKNKELNNIQKLIAKKPSKEYSKTTEVTKPDDVTASPLDKNIEELVRVINAADSKKALGDSSSEEQTTKPSARTRPVYYGIGSYSAHASPCPSGELRCVDGRCITLSQLCDGTIDCSDHADEDNCFT